MLSPWRELGAWSRSAGDQQYGVDCSACWKAGRREPCSVSMSMWEPRSSPGHCAERQVKDRHICLVRIRKNML